jgi:hypothetical protein
MNMKRARIPTTGGNRGQSWSETLSFGRWHLTFTVDPSKMDSPSIAPPPSEKLGSDDLKELQALFFQYDNMLHNRVTLFLLAQTLCIAGAANVWDKMGFVGVLALMGLALTLIFTFTNLKLNWRVLCLLKRYSRASPIFKSHLDMPNFDELRPSIVSRALKSVLGAKQSRWLDTGSLFTWGLFGVFVVTWLCLFAVSCCVSNAHVWR